MKKLLVVLMALLFTTGAFAQSTGAKFDYSLWGVAYGAYGSWGSDYKYDYQHIRLRPMLSASNQNVKGVVEFEINQRYGGSEYGEWIGVNDPYGTPTPVVGPGSDNAGISARNKAVQVRQAYLAANNVFMQGLGFTTGLKAYYYPLIADLEGAVTGASFDFGMGTATLLYLKIWEGDEYSKYVYKIEDDAQAYILDVAIKAGNIDVRPALFYANSGKDNYLVSELSAYVGAVNVTADMGMFDFDVTAAFLSAKCKDDFQFDKTTAYAFDLGVNVKPMPNLVIGVFGTYTSGSDDAKLGFSQTLSTLFNGQLPAGRLFILQHAGTQDHGGVYAIDGYTTVRFGNMVGGLSLQYTIDKLVLFAQFGYMMYDKKNLADEKVVGSEIDLKASYEVAPKTDLFLECAFITKGDDTVNSESAKQILWGLTTKI